MFAFFGLGCPNNGLGGVRETATAEVWWWVRFFPCNVVKNSEAELLHGVTDAKNDVLRTSHPNRAIGFQDALATLQPRAVEVVVLFRAPALIPVAFVDADHLTGMTCNTAVGKEVRRVGKNHIEAAFVAILGINGVEDFEAVTLIEENTVGVVPVGAVERDERGFAEGNAGKRAECAESFRLFSIPDVFR